MTDRGPPNWARVSLLVVSFALTSCAKAVPPPPGPPAAAGASPEPEPDMEALWNDLRTEVTVGNSDEWFASRSEGPDAISAILLRLLDEKVGACYEWVTEYCDDHHHAREPMQPGDDAGIDDECAAQSIFIWQMDRITEADRVAHAGSLVSLAAVDLANAEELLAWALELVPFESSVEDYALLAVHSDYQTEDDEQLRGAIEAVIEAQSESVQRRAYRALATQRDDPAAAMWAARSLEDLGDPQFLPTWSADTPLEEVVFQVRMLGASGDLPAEFVSKLGLTVRHVVRADRGTLESFDPPQETVTKIAWAPGAEFPAPWEENDLDWGFRATPQSCRRSQPNGAQCRSEADGTVTTVGFETQADGGFKVLSVLTEVDFPDCML